MNVLPAFDHLVNFFAPALALPVLLWPMARLVFGRVDGAPHWWVQWLAQAAVGAVVLLVGLWIFGRDGKMLTYAALVLACASVQWVFLRCWRR